jgi:hypothetical protein
MQLVLLISGALALSLRAPAASGEEPLTTPTPEFDYATGEETPDADSGDGYEEALEDHIHDAFKDVDPGKMADPDECTEEMVDMCKDLWEKRLKECEENAEKWAGMCEPPRYTDDEGRTHNCMKGQCSPIYKDVYEHKQEVEKQCHQFKGQPLQEVSCHVCESSYPTHPLECMNCGVHCFERHCEDPDSHECLANRAANDCLNACMHEALAEVCTHYEGALEVSCHMCEQFYPRKAVECMSCSTECAEKHCEDAGSEECLFSKEVGTCHKKCMEGHADMKPEEEAKMCDQFTDSVEQEACAVCEDKYPRKVMECMSCETECLETHCSGEEDIDDCAGLSVTRACHKKCMTKHTEEICGHFKENPVALEGCGMCANKYNSRVLECMECGSDCLKQMCGKDVDPEDCLKTARFDECHEPCMKDGFEETLEKLKNQLLQKQESVWKSLLRRAPRHTAKRQ